MAKKIVFFSTKGGVGRTLIASNLAVGLYTYNQKRVCLIDLDLEAVGDMARMLDLTVQKTMANLIHHLKKHPSADINDYIVRTTHGIDFLPGILKPQHSPHLEADKIKDVLELLDKDYDFIIIDAGKRFNDVLITVLNHANLILLLVTPDILSVYQTKWAIDTLQFLNFPLSMIRIVLNRAESAASISWQDLSVSLPVDIISRIPSEGKIVGQSVNRGVPVVIDSPRSKISSRLKEFSKELTEREDLFTEVKQIDQIRLKEMPWEKNGKFWKSWGLSETMIGISADEESDEILLLKRRIHSRLIEQLNLKKIDLKVFSDLEKATELKRKAGGIVANLLTEEAGSFISSSEVRRKLVKEIIDEALGLGPLEDLLADPAVTDIMVNNKDEIYVERNGKLELTSKKFISNEQVRTIIERIIAPLGRRIDESVPMVDARLSDGSRFNAIIPPLSLSGPCLAIRKFRKERFTIEELINLKTLNSQMGKFLEACVLSKRNMVVSGGTGSGKTTILNVLSGFVPSNERIVTIEDAAELKLGQEHWIRLESRSPNIEGKGAITIRDLFRNTLRMRPDRIIIGECRGSETWDMLQAMNTGHDGSMTTLHANSTQDVLVRLDSMILMSGIELPMRAIREMIASAVDLIVHTARMPDGCRKIVQITELAGMKDEMHININDIF
ncbi:MAG: Flp pilus assembly complex ATPase component TadA, partial [Candidatus Omnitrophica bacterium]|nr:Flp pilus assembly complex ATPase component TadA [Candidatus Omnitrophota bacterium]